MGENTSRPRRAPGRNRRPQGLSHDEKAAKDQRAMHWRNTMKMHRVYESAVMQREGVDPQTIRAVYWTPLQ